VREEGRKIERNQEKTKERIYKKYLFKWRELLASMCLCTTGWPI